MLRRFCAVLLLGITAVAADAADKPSGVTGLYLTTRYPALTVRAGETTTIDLSLRNFNLPPRELAATVAQAASGRQAAILGGGEAINLGLAPADGEEKAQLRLQTRTA